MNGQVVVQLTPAEIMMAATIGIMRQATNIRDSRKDRYGASKKDGWQLHVEGALGEAAVAKGLDIFWNGSIGTFSAPDVADLQVRSTMWSSGSLIVHKADSSKEIFILVTGVNGKYVLRGWMYGADAKNDEKYWKDPKKENRYAYFVPQRDLEPMNKLKRLMKRYI